MVSLLSGLSVGLALCSIVLWLPEADANVFLSRELPRLNLNAGDLMVELERVLGTGQRDETEAQANQMEDALQPIYKALPRDAAGRLDPAAVRYLLHRYFVEKHGWFVSGFDTKGDAWNSSSPTAALEGHDSDAQNVFQDRLGSTGLSLHEVALLAATLERFVHLETQHRLRAAYRIVGLDHDKEEHAQETEVLNALDTYMLMYVSGYQYATATAKLIEAQFRVMNQFYPGWSETKKWVREVRKEVLSRSPGLRNSFNTAVLVLEEISDRYGHFQDRECMELKESMLKIEHKGTGRVTLAKFYEAALNGTWQFSEHEAYLRQLGSLDESEPAKPSIMISNYINSMANCVAASKFYSVCCINECEALLGHIERQIAAPVAVPSTIIAIVEDLPSSTVDAPRKLSPNLVQRLNEIAKLHSGTVPFHARLFNQWLHHAYPRECPYPHVSGTSKQVKAQAWMKANSQNVEASAESMKWHMEQGRKISGTVDDFADDELPWSSEEEFFISHTHAAPAEQVHEEGAGPMIRTVAFLAISVSMTVSLVRMFSTARSGSTKKFDDKISV